MKTSMNHAKSKVRAKGKKGISSIQDVVDAELDLFEEGSHQVKNLAKYVKSNWKTVVPALAALGVGAFFYNKKLGTSIKRTISRHI